MTDQLYAAIQQHWVPDQPDLSSIYGDGCGLVRPGDLPLEFKSATMHGKTLSISCLYAGAEPWIFDVLSSDVQAMSVTPKALSITGKIMIKQRLYNKLELS
jgi:hypothetical protein